MTITAWKVTDNLLADIERTGWPEPDAIGQYAFVSSLNRLQRYQGKWYLRVVVLFKASSGQRVTLCERFTVDDDGFYLVDCNGQYRHLANSNDPDSCRLALTELFTSALI